MGIDNTLDALSSPIRRDILQVLRRKPMTVGQIAEQFDKLTYSAVSKQLSILKKAGLVDSQQIGTFVVYEINTTIFDDILAWVKGLREEVKGEVVKESRFDIVIRSRA